MTERILDPVGVEITHPSVRHPTDAEIEHLRHLLAEHGVVVIRGQAIDDDEFAAFLRRFGQPVFTVGEVPVPDRPELNIVSNLGRRTPPRSVFHVDTSYVRRPPAYTALRAVQVPASGGDTLFTNQYRAYRTLSDDLHAAWPGEPSPMSSPVWIRARARITPPSTRCSAGIRCPAGSRCICRHPSAAWRSAGWTPLKGNG